MLQLQKCSTQVEPIIKLTPLELGFLMIRYGETLVEDFRLAI